MAGEPLAKKKPLSYKSAMRKADRAFSEFIRLRDCGGSVDGYCHCISCGKIKTYREIQCGHYINRKHMGTRYAELNCYAQCVSCNCFDEGNKEGMMRGIIKRHGIDALDFLDACKKLSIKYTAWELDQLAEVYKKKVKGMKCQ